MGEKSHMILVKNFHRYSMLFESGNGLHPIDKILSIVLRNSNLIKNNYDKEIEKLLLNNSDFKLLNDKRNTMFIELEDIRERLNTEIDKYNESNSLLSKNPLSD